MGDYPEHEKMKRIPDDVRMRIGHWLETHEVAVWGCPHGSTERAEEGGGWVCDESRYCRWGTNEARLWPDPRPPVKIMAEMLGIDYDVLMAEKDSLLADLQSTRAGAADG